MRTRTHRGVALLMTLFALVILSVIGLGMMSTTNMETSINSNYRDKQDVFYSAKSALQEARDRIQPATANITAPIALPSLSAANIIYIINPKAGETVAPWDMTNKYKDTELCQEQVLGLSGTAGVRCTTIASGSSWYSVVDDSQASSAPWNSTAPVLDFKWARISLKGNNMTVVAVNGDSTDNRQVCWDGAHQIVLPAGYGPNCGPNGSVGSITLTNQGTGYTSAPTVTFSAPPSGGTQATGSATITQITDGQVASINLTSAGSGYTSAPTVTITGVGTGATATATIAGTGSPVASFTLNSAGTQCYAVTPTVAVTGGGGSGAGASVTLASTKSCIAGWTVSGNCSAQKGNTVSGVGLSGGGGSGFSGTVTFDHSHGSVTSYSIQLPGTTYTSSPTALTGLTGCSGLTFTTLLGYVVSSVSLTASGSNYGSAPTVTVATGAGTNASAAQITANLGAPPSNAGQVTSVTVNTPGSGYILAPVVTFTGGGASTQATGSAVLGVTNVVSAINLLNAGKGYTSDPTVSITGGGGSGATATAAIGRGPYYGLVYLITALAQTSSGARSMLQTEVATPVTGLNFTGGISLDGPSPTVSLPNSSNFLVNGNDANSCGGTAQPSLSAMAGYDDPNAKPATNSVNTIISAIPSGRSGNYTGAGTTPSVTNVFGATGDTMSSPSGLKAYMDAVEAAPGANVYGNNPSNIALGTSSAPIVDYVAGNLSLSGNSTGYGILAVTGTLTMDGNFNWYGPILVIGDGILNTSGGGNGQIVGSMIVAKIWDSYTTQNLLATLGSPTMNWYGGGGNGVQYDHCWANNLLSKVPFLPPPSTKPLKVLAARPLSY